MREDHYKCEMQSMKDLGYMLQGIFLRYTILMKFTTEKPLNVRDVPIIRLAIGYVGLVFSIYWYQIGSLMELELEWVWGFLLVKRKERVTEFDKTIKASSHIHFYNFEAP